MRASIGDRDRHPPCICDRVGQRGSTPSVGEPAPYDDGHASESTGQQFDVSLMCDDLDKTMADLTGKGAEFTGEVRDQGWGITVRLKVPGAGEMMLYQPKYDPPAVMR